MFFQIQEIYHKTVGLWKKKIHHQDCNLKCCFLFSFVNEFLFKSQIKFSLISLIFKRVFHQWWKIYNLIQVYLPSLWLLISFSNPVEATEPDSDYKDPGARRCYKSAICSIATLGYAAMTLSILICLRKIFRQRDEAAAAEHDEYRLTTATRKLDIRVIESFPEIIFPQIDAKFHFIDCHICLEEFRQGEILVVLPTCAHAYHKDCIGKWMATRNSCCPDCRHDYGFVWDHVNHSFPMISWSGYIVSSFRENVDKFRYIYQGMDHQMYVLIYTTHHSVYIFGCKLQHTAIHVHIPVTKRVMDSGFPWYLANQQSLSEFHDASKVEKKCMDFVSFHTLELLLAAFRLAQHPTK